MYNAKTPGAPPRRLLFGDARRFHIRASFCPTRDAHVGDGVIKMSSTQAGQSSATTASSFAPAASRRKPTLADRLALLLLKLAKLRRVQLKSVSGDYDEFYEKFFEEK